MRTATGDRANNSMFLYRASMLFSCCAISSRVVIYQVPGSSFGITAASAEPRMEAATTFFVVGSQSEP